MKNGVPSGTAVQLYTLSFSVPPVSSDRVLEAVGEMITDFQVVPWCGILRHRYTVLHSAAQQYFRSFGSVAVITLSSQGSYESVLHVILSVAACAPVP